MDKDERIRLALELQKGSVVISGLTLEEVKTIPIECAIAPRDVKFGSAHSAGVPRLIRHDQGAVRHWKNGKRLDPPERSMEA